MFTFVYYSLASTRRRERARERQGEREQVKEWKYWKILEIFLSFCARCNMLFYSQLVALFLAENFLFLFTTRTACKCKKILLQLLLIGMMPRKFLTYSHPGINVVAPSNVSLLAIWRCNSFVFLALAKFCSLRNCCLSAEKVRKKSSAKC